VQEQKKQREDEDKPSGFAPLGFSFCGGGLVEGSSRRPKLLNRILSQRSYRSVIAVLSIRDTGNAMRQIAQAAEPSADQRQYERVSAGLLGKLFVPAENVTIDRHVLNLSAGGASVKCNEPPSLQTFVVLYVDGFGRFEGTALRFTEGELGLKFDCKDAKRQRLVYALNAFVRDGSTTNTRLRSHPRMSAGSAFHFTRANGEQPLYEVIDISLLGASLRTISRPVVGEQIEIGRTRGRVVRHHPDGIAIEFLSD
jgi:hypothetical protein